jgi:DNA-binding PadR family transcriptional regulator
MHGHGLRLLAEEEHVHMWTDITVGAVYGAIKRLASEGLIHEVRLEREGSYPERQVYGITEDGRAALRDLRDEGLRTVVVKPDPFDLAMTRLDPGRLGELEATITQRIAGLERMLADSEAGTARALPYLTLSESIVMRHRAARLRAELDWHNHLLLEIPAIVADESARKELS